VENSLSHSLSCENLSSWRPQTAKRFLMVPFTENRAAPLECRIAPLNALHRREEFRNRRRGMLRAVRARAGVLATIFRPRLIGPDSMPQKAPLECRTSAGIPSKVSHARFASRHTDWRDCGRQREAAQARGLQSSS
jgi:hypothetical protein